MAKSKSPFPAEITTEPLDTLEGAVERLTFADPESHYAVVRLKVKGRRHEVTAVGPLAAVKEGEELFLKGKYELHPKWGEQFKVVWWYAVLPATVAGIEKYLASGLIKGIGPELAQRLVAHFGPDTLQMIDGPSGAAARSAGHRAQAAPADQIGLAGPKRSPGYPGGLAGPGGGPGPGHQDL